MITAEEIMEFCVAAIRIVPIGSYWKHKKTGGVYQVSKIGIEESNLETKVIYQSLDYGLVWIRPFKEFTDGRFERVSDSNAPNINEQKTSGASTSPQPGPRGKKRIKEMQEKIQVSKQSAKDRPDDSKGGPGESPQ